MTPRVFRTAVELDEYLATLTEEERARLRPNISLKDQVSAAQAEGIAEEEYRLRHKARWVPHAGLPEWVRLGMYDTLLKWSEDQALTCIHMPTINKPQPVFAAAWKPGVVACAQCRHLLTVVGVADTICDGCGHECKGMPDDGIKPVTAFVGALAYQFGVCVNCDKDLQRVEKEASGR